MTKYIVFLLFNNRFFFFLVEKKAQNSITTKSQVYYNKLPPYLGIETFPPGNGS